MSRKATHNLAAAPVSNRDAAVRSAEPTEDEIRIRAFEVYCARNGFNGTAENDWLEAERELRERSTAAPSGLACRADVPPVLLRSACSMVGPLTADLQMQPA